MKGSEMRTVNMDMRVFAEKFQPEKIPFVRIGGIPNDEILRINTKKMF